MSEPTTVHSDNQSCTRLSKNPVFHDHSKHINIRYHFLEDKVQKGVVILKYVPLDSQVADSLTKPLAKGKFEMLRETLGLVENTFLTKRKC
jgi:hypothetical protein